MLEHLLFCVSVMRAVWRRELTAHASTQHASQTHKTYAVT